MADRPLSVLMSQALIAFTIEFDNEFERRMPHRTSLARGGTGPWLTSMTMWANFVRLVPPDGVPLREMASSGAITNLDGLRRWGYIDVSDGVIRLTRDGAAARAIWDPLAEEIERRWRDRFGDDRIDRLIAALAPAIKADLPRFLPVVPFSTGMRSDRLAGVPGYVADDLISHLAQALLALTIGYEQPSPLSLPMTADLVRVLDSAGVDVRDLPRRSGVSKEAIASALKFLAKRDLVTMASESGSNVARLTERGVDAQAQYRSLIITIEAGWPGADAIRAAIPAGDELALGLEPPPDGWRAQRPYASQTAAVLADPVAALPHHPMVLHRGGYPDGS